MPLSRFAAARINARRLSAALYDVAAWFLATLALAGARYDFSLAGMQWEAAFRYAIVSSLAMLGVGFSMGLYRGHFRMGSFQEAFRLATAVLAITLVVGVAFLITVPEFPRGLALAVPPGALLLMASARWMARAAYERAMVPSAVETAEPTLIYGAGIIGGQLGDAMRVSREQHLSVVGYLDDDPSKRRLHLPGGRVLGRGEDMEEVPGRPAPPP